MIGYIEGSVVTVRPTHCIIFVGSVPLIGSAPGGIGYKVFATKETLAGFTIGSNPKLWIHTVIREDAQDLYGFVSDEELRFFELLLTVSGIGPRSALAVLDTVSIETLRSAVSEGRAEYLTKVSGIGKKTAEKIVLELRDKVGIGSSESSYALKGDEDALEALRSLGYSGAEARDTLRKVPVNFSNTNDRLREALKLLGSRT